MSSPLLFSVLFLRADAQAAFWDARMSFRLSMLVSRSRAM
jgi:hypothetical protein